MSRRRDEENLQGKIVARLRREFDCRVCHVANGGKRSRLEAIRLKAMGVEAGHPDLVVYGRRGRAFLIEVKSDEGALSVAQTVFLSDLKEREFPVYVVRTLDEAVAAATKELARRPAPAPLEPGEHDF